VKIEVFPMGVFQVNSYLLRCEETGKIVVVDPGDEAVRLVRRLEELDTVPEAILNTHGHVDHVAGNGTIRARWDAPILMHPDDRWLIDGFEEQVAMFGLDWPKPPPPDEDLVPGRPFTFGRCTLHVLHTPGHSPGHVSFAHRGDVISGDVLFAGSIGRTDLPRGDLDVLLRSIDEVLVPLGDSTRVHPGHGPSTTIGRERRSNPFLQHELRAELRRAYG
jgi:glyoxylase-like metal-dependent hydrolase (beta-lactamase superfamily II)